MIAAQAVALGGPRESEHLCRGCGLGNFFTDVLQQDGRFHSRKPLNDLDLLEPATRSLVQQVIQEAGTLGISLMAFATYRSQDRQLDLFDQGPVPQVRERSVRANLGRKWSSFRHYALRQAAVMEIESQWTARDREASKTCVAARIFLCLG